jgi:beta-mannanase
MIKNLFVAFAIMLGLGAGVAQAATPWTVGVFPPSTSYNGGYSTVTPFDSLLNIPNPKIENFYTDMSMLPGTNGANWENSSNYNLGGFDTASVNGGPNNSTNPWLPSSGVIPMGSIEMATQTSTSGALSLDTYLQNIAAGDYDTAYKGVIQDWYNAGYHTQYWRPGVEFNEYENVYNCGTDSTCMGYWRAAWDRIYTDMHSEASAIGANVTVIWNPGADAGGQVDPSLTTTYWPGAAYVDQIGLDLYDNSYPDNSSNTCANYTAPNYTCANQSASPAFGLFAALAFAKAQGKAVSFDETGASTDNPLFVEWLSGVLKATTTTIAFVDWWDSNGGCACQFTPPSSAGKPNMAAAVATYFGTNAAVSKTPSTPSPTGTQVNGPIGSLQNSTSDVVSINTAGQIVLDGAIVASSHGVTVLFQTNTGFVQLAGGNWYMVPVDGSAGAATTQPVGFTVPHAASPANTAVNGTAGSIYDQWGNQWAINGAGQETVNGTIVPSSGVLTIFFDGTAMHQLTGTGWYTQPEDGTTGVSEGTPAGYTATVTYTAITVTPATTSLSNQLSYQAFNPYSGVVITDPNASQTEHATVTWTSAAYGTLSDPNAPNDGSTVSGTTMTIPATTAAALATTLDNLVFTPIPQGATGSTLTTTLTATVTDAPGAQSNTSVTTAVVTQTPHSFVGSHC